MAKDQICSLVINQVTNSQWCSIEGTRTVNIQILFVRYEMYGDMNFKGVYIYIYIYMHFVCGYGLYVICNECGVCNVQCTMYMCVVHVMYAGIKVYM